MFKKLYLEEKSKYLQMGGLSSIKTLQKKIYKLLQKIGKENSSLFREFQEINIAIKENYAEKEKYVVKLESLYDQCRSLVEENKKSEDSSVESVKWNDGSCPGFCCDGYSKSYELEITFSKKNITAILNTISTNNVGDYKTGSDEYETTNEVEHFNNENIQELVSILKPMYISTRSEGGGGTKNAKSIIEKIINKIERTTSH